MLQASILNQEIFYDSYRFNYKFHVCLGNICLLKMLFPNWDSHVEEAELLVPILKDMNTKNLTKVI